jgi:sec-independent protein translocase protein TatA
MMTAWTLLFFSGQEILIVVLAVLLLFGSKEIPRMARMFGQGMKEFRRATEDIKREMQDSSADVVKDFKEIRDDLKKDANEVVENVKKQVDSDSDKD